MSNWIFIIFICVLLPLFIMLISNIERICNNIVRLIHLLGDISSSLNDIKIKIEKNDDQKNASGRFQTIINASNKKIFNTTIILNDGTEIKQNEKSFELDKNILMMLTKSNDLNNLKLDYELYPLEKIKEIIVKIKTKKQETTDIKTID